MTAPIEEHASQTLVLAQPVGTPPVSTTANEPSGTADQQPVKKSDIGVVVVDRLLAGLRASVELAIREKNPTRLKQLSLGRIRKSKVLGVQSPEKVEELIIDCAAATEPMSVQPHPRNEHLTVYRFAVPANWKAFGRCIRLGELLGINHKFASFLETVVVKRTVDNRVERSVKFQAPQLSPFQTTVVTFIYNEANQRLEDWFAGEDPTLFPVNSNENVWVHCGVDLLQEK